ncbi:MAG: GntP family permease [Mangrovibacterium sp.]
MNEFLLLVGIAVAIALLMFLVLKLKIHAFISLLIVSIFVGLIAGMDFAPIMESIKNGMGNTLGFVATVVGLGAIFGQMLESSGGAESIARYMIRTFGEKRASWAMMFTGLIVAIPVFLDVGLIILIPIVYEMTRQAKKSILFYGIPLVAGLAVGHSFIPPTPGPVAVAEILEVQLGWVILGGIIIGIPTAIIAGPLFGRYISRKINVAPPDYFTAGELRSDQQPLPSFRVIMLMILLPLVLIITGTVGDALFKGGVIKDGALYQAIGLLGHPFTALIISTLLAIYILGIRRGMGKDQVMQLSNKALAPAGLIILVTGAGGVLKQILIDSGIGGMLAESLAGSAMPPFVLAYLIAAVVRIIQGSATVSMITAAGIMAPLLSVFDLSQIDKSLIVIAIAAGATILSHVNDSGFWLVGKYLGLNEKETLRSWTIMETIISVTGFLLVLLASLLV